MERLTEEQHKLVEDNHILVHFLMGKNKNLVNSVRRYDDPKSVGYVSLCKAAKTFDPNKGAFSTIATHYVVNEWKKVIRDAQRHKRKIYDEMTYLESITNKEDDTFWEDIVSGGATVEEVVDHKALVESLTEMSKGVELKSKTFHAVVDIWLNDPYIKKKTIAEVVGISQNSVSIHLRKFKEYAKEYLLAN